MSTEVKVNVTVGGANEAAKEVGKVNDELNTATGALDKVTGGAVTAFKSMIGGLKGAVRGLKTFKGALISTGIGALVVAVGSLVSYFTKTERGAEMLEKAMAGLQGVTNVLADRASAMGEAIMNAITNPKEAIISFGNTIKTYITDRVASIIDGLGLMGKAISLLFEGEFDEAASTAAEGFKKVYYEGSILESVVEGVGETITTVASQVKTAATAMSDLAARSIQLRKDQRQLRKEFAEGRAAFKEYNLIAEDTTASLEDRLAAAEAAINIEQSLMAERQRLAQEEVDIQKAKMALSENTEEDYERLTELEVALINIREESAERQTTINNKLNIIRNQAKKEAEDALKAEQDLLNAQYEAQDKLLAALQTAEENEIDAVNAKYDALFDLAYANGLDTTGLIERQQAEVAAITKKYSDQEVAQTEAAEARKVQARVKGMQAAVQVGMALSGFLQQILTADSDATEEQQRKAFEQGKKLQIAGVVMSTASAIMAALAAPPVGYGSSPAGIAASITAGLLGATQIAAISKQQFGATASTDTGGSATTSFTRALTPENFATSATTPTGNNMGNQEPLRAYVVSTEMTSQQQLDAQLSHRSRL